MDRLAKQDTGKPNILINIASYCQLELMKIILNFIYNYNNYSIIVKRYNTSVIAIITYTCHYHDSV